MKEINLDIWKNIKLDNKIHKDGDLIFGDFEELEREVTEKASAILVEILSYTTDKMNESKKFKNWKQMLRLSFIYLESLESGI